LTGPHAQLGRQVLLARTRLPLRRHVGDRQRDAREHGHVRRRVALVGGAGRALPLADVRVARHEVAVDAAPEREPLDHVGLADDEQRVERRADLRLGERARHEHVALPGVPALDGAAAARVERAARADPAFGNERREPDRFLAAAVRQADRRRIEARLGFVVDPGVVELVDDLGEPRADLAVDGLLREAVAVGDLSLGRTVEPLGEQPVGFAVDDLALGAANVVPAGDDGQPGFVAGAPVAGAFEAFAVELAGLFFAGERLVFVVDAGDGEQPGDFAARVRVGGQARRGPRAAARLRPR
jgi:hypothetical protein